MDFCVHLVLNDVHKLGLFGPKRLTYYYYLCFLHYWPLNTDININKTASKRNYCQYWILDSVVVCDYLFFVNNKVVYSNFDSDPSKVFSRKLNNWYWMLRCFGSGPLRNEKTFSSQKDWEFIKLFLCVVVKEIVTRLNIFFTHPFAYRFSERKSFVNNIVIV
jgi:hypothetical protein